MALDAGSGLPERPLLRHAQPAKRLHAGLQAVAQLEEAMDQWNVLACTRTG